jgi:type I restriction enzyme, S subunit
MGTTPSKKNNKYYGNEYPLYKPTDLNAGINTRNAKDYLSKIGIT